MTMRSLWLVLALLGLSSATAPRFERFCGRSDQGRSDRGLNCGSASDFEAFASSGAGTFGACSTTPPVAVYLGNTVALTHTRATPAQCTKGAAGGLRNTGINDGDVLPLAINEPRVEFDGEGYLGLKIEAAASTINIQARPICNAAYSDVGTPDCAADITTGPWGTTTMGRLTDNDGAAKEGRSQTVASTSATRFTTFCYVKAGTAAEATIILAGTGSATGDCTATITGLSTSTSSIIECTSPAAFAGTLTAVTVSILVGDAVGDQGTLFVEGCDVKPSALYRTSLNDTGAAGITRAVDSAAFTLPSSLSSANGLSWSASVQHPSGNGGGVWAGSIGLVQDASNRTQLYRQNTNVLTCDYVSTAGTRSAGPVISAFVANQVYRQGCSYSGPGAASVITGYRDGVVTGASAAGLTGTIAITTIIPCALGAAASAGPADGICSRIKAHPSPLGGL